MLKFLFMFSLFSSASPLLSVVLQFQVLMKFSVSVSVSKKKNKDGDEASRSSLTFYSAKQQKMVLCYV